MKQSDKGIFLHRISYSETSLIVSFFTLHHGLQKFIFQGGKKKAHALFPLSLCEISYYKRPDSELGKLTEATTYESLMGIQIDPVKSTIAFFMTDVINKCLHIDNPDSILYDFLEQEILNLNNSEDLRLLPVEFLIRLTDPLGIEPAVDSENKKYFYFEEGEFSNLERRGELGTHDDSVKLIQEILRKEKVIETTKADRRSALDIVLKYYEAHIPKFEVNASLSIIKETLE